MHKDRMMRERPKETGTRSNATRASRDLRRAPLSRTSSGVSRAASAAAEPPEEPPGVRWRSHGLAHVPWSALYVCTSACENDSRGRPTIL